MVVVVVVVGGWLLGVGARPRPSSFWTHLSCNMLVCEYKTPSCRIFCGPTWLTTNVFSISNSNKTNVKANRLAENTGYIYIVSSDQKVKKYFKLIRSDCYKQDWFTKVTYIPKRPILRTYQWWPIAFENSFNVKMSVLSRNASWCHLQQPFQNSYVETACPVTHRGN